MGAWGIGTFENDSALDWLFDYEAGGADTVVSAFSDLGRDLAAGHADVDVGASALAASEVVAASFGAPLDGLDPEILADLLTHDAAVTRVNGIRNMAVEAAAAAVESTSISELAALWDEAGQTKELRAVAAELTGRIEGTR